MDKDEEMRDSSATKQQNDRSQSSGERMRTKQPTDCHQQGVSYKADSEKDSSEPKSESEMTDSKSKVDCYGFTIVKLISSVSY